MKAIIDKLLNKFDEFKSWIHCWVLNKPPLWGDALPCDLKYCRYCGKGRRK